MEIICRNVAAYLAYFIRAREQGSECVLCQDVKRRYLGFKDELRATTYHLPVNCVTDCSAWFSDSGETTALYTEEEILDALGMTLTDLRKALQTKTTRAAFYKMTPFHGVSDRQTIQYENWPAWIDALTECKNVEHNLYACDEIRTRLMGFIDMDTGLWHQIKVGYLIEGPDDLHTKQGRRERIEGAS